VLDHALGRVLASLAALLPRRLRRAAERLERRRKPVAELAAAGFLLVSVFYGLLVGGQIGRVGDSLLVLAGFGIADVSIDGTGETSELLVLETLDLSGSLLAFDVEAAQRRVEALPWVANASVRKFYPDRLQVEIDERTPFALWQHGGEVTLIDGGGTEIVALDDQRFARLPLVVGGGANVTAADLLADLFTQPAIAAQMRAAVLVGGRRWNILLDNGVTVKLPQHGVTPALALLARLDAEAALLARDVIAVDLRLADRVTVELPEGRSLNDVPSIIGGRAAT
jgi:cell division protein FtsQ